MKVTMENARGHIVGLESNPYPALMDFGKRIAEALTHHAEVVGVIVGGSCAYALADGFSDLDLYVFGEDEPACEKVIHECCRALGGQLDPDASSIHFPLDSPGYLFRELYVEPGAVTVRGVEDELGQVLSAKRIDEGRLYSIRNGVLLADRHGELERLMVKLAEAAVPREYADWYTSIAFDVPVKLIIHSVHRKDYPHAWYWLERFYFECVRILFAREGRFFPGTKRTLTHTLSQLENIPEGFAAFWQETFSRGVRDWDMVLEEVVETARVLKSLPHIAQG